MNYSQKHLNKVVQYFIYSLFLFLTISGTVLVTYVIHTETKQQQQERQRLLQDWLTASISEAVYRYDLPGIKALASQAILNDWLDGISVSNERDIVLIEQGIIGQPEAARLSAKQGKHSEVILTLNYDDESVGFVHYFITSIESPVNALLLLKTIAILIVLTLLLSLLVRRFVEKKITQPINKLTDAVSENNTQQLKALMTKQNVPHEIAQLAAEFLASNTKLVSEATEDFLTSLPNRRAFESKLQYMLSHQIKFVLGLIDVDNFKHVNDTFGHDVGDVLLVSCAKVVSDTMTDAGYAARLGGDEFAFILEHASMSEATAIADNIIDGIKNITNGSPEIRLDISASIGLAGSLDNASAQDVLRFADIALYKSKNAGRAQYTVYRSGFDEQPKRWVEVQSSLNRALSVGHANYELEPIRYLSNRTAYGVEMLLRLRDSEGKFISPLSVIDVATQTGKLEGLSQLTLDAGIAVLKFQTDVSNVFLNFSGTELAALNTAEFFQKIRSLGNLTQHMVFEITESTYLEDPKIANMLQKLRSMGIRIALDDFGTGYSSLACLSTLPLDFVKIDQSIVCKAFEDHRARTILRVILALRQEFGFEVITEGVESEQVLEFLRDEGVIFAQGFLLNQSPRFTSHLSMLKNTHVLSTTRNSVSIYT